MITVENPLKNCSKQIQIMDIENNKRRCESENNFGWGFIPLARDVYFYNDKRAEIKENPTYTNPDAVEENNIRTTNETIPHIPKNGGMTIRDNEIFPIKFW